MKHILLLLSNDSQENMEGLFLKEKNILSLFDTNVLYPLEWQKKDLKITAQKLIWLVTYGLVDLRTIEHTFEAKDLFSSENYKAVQIKLKTEFYQKLLIDLDSITKYMKYKTYESRNFVSLTLSNEMKCKQITLQSMHCIRTFINK